MRLFFLVIFFLLKSTDVLADDIPPVVVLASTDWCPYSCLFDETERGIINEYVTILLARKNIELDVRVVPWSRAVYEANQGRTVHGLLTAVHEEAPDLLFTSTPIMSYEVCFFTNKESVWSYQGPVSLKGERLGVIQDYGYGPEIDFYIRKAANSKGIVPIKGGSGVVRLMSMLKNDRFDVFLDDRSVVSWEASRNNIKEGELRNAGCLESTPFYLAVNPTLPWAKTFVGMLDELFALPENKRTLKRIYEKYTLRD